MDGSLVERADRRLTVDTSQVNAIPMKERSSPDDRVRWRHWRRGQLETPDYVAEYLLPRITRKIEREWPPFMSRRGDPAQRPTATELADRVRSLGPWPLPFRLDHGVVTRPWPMGGRSLARETRDRILFRQQLITGTVALLLGDELRDATVLDIGCNAGFFSLDLADRGAKHVWGVDLREENIAQARFLAAYYGIDNVSFEVSDADRLPEEQFDVVLNLGVLYHVTDPLGFMRQTCRLTRQFAVIDTKAHPEPVSAYLLRCDVDTNVPTEGRESVELQPTYRGAIDTLRYAGFTELVEVVGEADPPHGLYESGERRCFLAAR